MTKQIAIFSTLLVATMLAGCGSHAAPNAGALSAASIAAQSAAHKGAKASAKRPAPPAGPKVKATTQGFAANNAANAANNALAAYQNLSYQWQSAWSDYDKDQIETQMLNALHQGLTDTQSITSAQGVDATDRRSYDIADQGLNRYDSSYRQWQSTWDDSTKRMIVNQMLNDMVNTLQQVKANY